MKKKDTKVSLLTKQIVVIVEIIENEILKDYPITFFHKIKDGKGWFESNYKGEKIIIFSNGIEIMDFCLPKGLTVGSKDRIQQGINEYLNRLLS